MELHPLGRFAVTRNGRGGVVQLVAVVTGHVLAKLDGPAGDPLVSFEGEGGEFLVARERGEPVQMWRVRSVP
jgi:hypothetical protein